MEMHFWVAFTKFGVRIVFLSVVDLLLNSAGTCLWYSYSRIFVLSVLDCQIEVMQKAYLLPC